MKKQRAAAVILTAALILSACGSSGGSASSTSYNGDYAAEETASGDAYYESASYDYVEGDAENANGDKTADIDQPKAQDGQKIIYTADLRLQSLEYDVASASIHDKIKAAGGFIESENESDSNYNWYTNNTNSGNSAGTRKLFISARIPTEQFDSFLNSLEGDGKVMSRNVEAQNISQVYADTKTYEEALEKEQKRLLEMMDKAETIDEMIRVEERLSEVERQLNQYKTQLATMDKRVAYSTVNISLEEVKRYSTEVHEISFGEALRQAFGEGIESFKEFCQYVAIFVARYFFFLILLAVIIILIIAASRRSKRKKIAMMADPEYAKAMTAKERLKTEKLIEKQARKDAKKSSKRVYRRRKTDEDVNDAAGAGDAAGAAGTAGTADAAGAGDAAGTGQAAGTADAAGAGDAPQGESVPPAAEGQTPADGE